MFDQQALRKDIKRYLALNGIKKSEICEHLDFNTGNFSHFLKGNKNLADWRVLDFCNYIEEAPEKYYVEEK